MASAVPGQRLLLLDGGMGHLLKERDLSRIAPGLQFDSQFAAGALANGLVPDLIRSVHDAYIAAGCDVITSNTFGCTAWSLGRVNQAHRATELAAAGARIARDAADAAQGPVLVAGGRTPIQTRL
jgi:5-methyltetrahydrofolate--homocysteine methyltransferase